MNLTTKELISLLELYKDFGIEDFLENKPINRLNSNNNHDLFEKKSVKSSPKSPTIINTPNPSSTANNSVIDAELPNYTKGLVEKINSIEGLEKTVLSFRHLSICKTATKTVFADGNRQAKVMLVGEAPGEQEDLQGIPFCGESGQLLNTALSYIGLLREKNLYITNSVFWRPPGNRKPSDFELSVCEAFVEKHIALINPKVIIFCGATSANFFLKNDSGITQLKNANLTYENKYLKEKIKAFAIYHPSYLLRQPMKKKEFWLDLLKMQGEMKDLLNT